MNQKRNQGFAREAGTRTKKEIRDCKRCRRHLNQERDQGLARNVGTCTKKEIRGLQEVLALEPRKRSGACKGCRHLSQERDHGLARNVGTGAKKKILALAKT